MSTTSKWYLTSKKNKSKRAPCRGIGDCGARFSLLVNKSTANPRGAGGAKGYALFAGQQNAQHGFFYMQAVFGFIKNLVCVGFKNVGGDLLAAVGGQGMLHDTVRLG